MIRFFQNIRKNLAAENKMGSYLRYAIGEIVLVVVGILIALSINNWNEQRKTENRIVEILKEVQNDLGKNIREADKTIGFYKNKKAKILQILNDELTYDDYKNNPLSSRFFLFGSSHIKLYENGYKELMQNANGIPDKYRIIINPLQELYIYNKYEIDKFDENVTQTIGDFYKTLNSKFNWWYSEATSLTISDEMIEYFSTPNYKNFAYRYAANSWTLLSSTLYKFRYNAVDVYLEIAKLIGNEDEVPEYVDHNFIKIDSTILKQYTGTYKLIPADSDNPSTADSKGKISIEGNHLLVNNASDSSGTVTDVYFRSIDVGYDNRNLEYQFTRNKDSTVSGCIVKIYFTLISDRDVHYKKIE